MDGFSFATATTSASAATSSLFINATTRLPSFLYTRRRARSVSLRRRKQKLLVFASIQESEFNEWEKMELKFGRMIDEDPKLTLAKIKARRLNPDATFLEVEKSFHKNKGKPVDIEEIPHDWARPSREVSPPEHVQVESSVDGLILVRPVPKKGVKFESSNKPNALEIRKPSLPIQKPVENVKRSVPNVILRKPTVSKEEDVGEKPSGLSFRPNLSLNISNAQSAERFSDMTLLRKPEPLDVDKIQELSGNAKAKVMDDIKLKMSGNENIDKSDMMLLRKPKPMGVNNYWDKKQELSDGAKAKAVDDIELKMLLRKPEPLVVDENVDKEQERSGDAKGKISNAQSAERFSDTTLLRKPEPLDVDKIQELSGNAKAKVMDDIKLKMSGNENIDKSDMMLLRKPKPTGVIKYRDKKQELSDGAKDKAVDGIELKMLLKKPEPLVVDENVDKEQKRYGDAKAKVVDDIELKKSVNENNDKSVMRLSRKPEPTAVNEHRDKIQEFPGGAKTKSADDIELKMGEEEGKVKQSDFTLLKKPEAVWAPSNLDGKKKQFEDPEVQVSEDVQQNCVRGSSESSEIESARTDEIKGLVEAIHGLLSEKAKMGDIGSKMGEEEAKVKHSDFTLLKKPEAVWAQSNLDGKKVQFEDPDVQVSDIQQNGLRGSSEFSDMEDARTDVHERLVDAIDGLLSEKAKMYDIELKMEEEEAKVKHSDFTLLKKPEAVWAQSNLDGEKKQFEDPEVQVSDDVQQNGLRGSSESSEMEDASTDELKGLVKVIHGLISKEAKMGDIGSKMGEEEAKVKHSDFTLLKKPEAVWAQSNLDGEKEQFEDPDVQVSDIQQNGLRGSSEFSDMEDARTDVHERLVDAIDGLLSEKAKMYDIELKMEEEEAKVKHSDFTLLKKPEAVWAQSNLDGEKEQFEDPDVQVSDDVQQNGLRGSSESSEMVDARTYELKGLVKAIHGLISKEAKMGDIGSKMGEEEAKVKHSDFTLLEKPEAVWAQSNLDGEKEQFEDPDVQVSDIQQNGLRGSSEFSDMEDARTDVHERLVDAIDGLLSEKAKMYDIELKMEEEEAKVKRSDFTLLKKPEAVWAQSNLDGEKEQFEDPDVQVSDDVQQNCLRGSSESSEMEDARTDEFESLVEDIDGLLSKQAKMDDVYDIAQQQLVQGDMGSTEEEIGPSELSATSSVNSNSSMKFAATLQGKPQRLDQPVRKTSKPARADAEFSFPAESYRSGGSIELESSLKASPSKDLEDTYWRLAEEMLNMGRWEKVELISASSKGFVVSLGPLVGFLPYTQLPAKKKFFAFETWLRKKGLDPSLYWDKLEIIRSYGIANTNPSTEVDQKIEGRISPDMQLEDLLKIYDQEKIKFMSSFVGQTPTVCALMADRGSQKLIFSLIPWKDEGIIEKKRSLMAKLRIGDVVTCRITRIAYFGVFVEVEGVPAMIHQTEISWDATLDPSSYFKIGQILDAKVHQLNFELERIFLSLKDITPDPLSEVLESVIGDRNPLDERLQAAEADTEWADVESLVRELQQIEGVQSASKGQFFFSPGFVPTFQVYMASMFADQYRLLARSGNKVQEVIVQSSLDKEAMKAAILKCTK